jgi:hypothetical protein
MLGERIGVTPDTYSCEHGACSAKEKEIEISVERVDLTEVLGPSPGYAYAATRPGETRLYGRRGPG